MVKVFKFPKPKVVFLKAAPNPYGYNYKSSHWAKNKLHLLFFTNLQLDSMKRPIIS